MNSELNTESFLPVPENEQRELNGGNPFLVAFAVVCAAQIILDWDNFKNGLMGRPEVTP